MPADISRFPVAEGRGAVDQAPDLPQGFRVGFSSRIVDAGGLRQHVVIGGSGPPVLLVHGWPQSWYAWRLVMPALAEIRTVVVVDQRGVGLTGKPDDGYDAGTLSGDLIAVMAKLGHERFSVVGHDTGMVIGYALAADHPARVDRLVVVELAGPPGLVASSPLIVPALLSDRLWHLPFARAGRIAEQLIHGREDVFFGYQFAGQGGSALSPTAIEHYIGNVADARSLRCSLGFYREWETTLAQNEERATRSLQMPVLAIGGSDSWGEHVREGIEPAACDVQAVVIADAGHWVAEQAPDELLDVLLRFLSAKSRS